MERKKEHTQLRKLKNVSLHTHPIISMFPQKRQPQLDALQMSILDLNQPPHGPTLKILLTLLVHEHAPGDGPTLDDAGERYGTGGREIEVVGRAQCEVAEELEVADIVGAQLEIADWHAVLGSAAEGFEVYCLHGAGVAGVEVFTGMGLDVCFVLG